MKMADRTGLEPATSGVTGHTPKPPYPIDIYAYFVNIRAQKHWENRENWENWAYRNQ